MVNLFAVRGHDPDISTEVTTLSDGGRVHVSSGARIGGLEAPGQEIRFTLTGVSRQDAYVLVGNVPHVTTVSIGQRDVPRVESLAEVGWLYDDEHQQAILHLAQVEDTIRVVLRWTRNPEKPVNVTTPESVEVSEPPSNADSVEEDASPASDADED
jgi:hypothetical protein